jgi:hypothetical protein
MYTPTKDRYKRFKRVISDNSTLDPPDANEETEWNGFSSDLESLNDASRVAIGPSGPGTGRARGHSGRAKNSARLESFEPPFDSTRLASRSRVMHKIRR